MNRDAGGGAPSPADDERLFEQLELYTKALQAGRPQRCAELLEECPELREYVDCLDVLDGFGSARRAADPPAAAYAATISSSSSGSSSFNSTLLQPGQPFGKYVIHEEVGRGGMGVVFRALQTELERDVALKVIRSHQLAGEEELHRFKIEARAAARLQHPHIVSVHESGEVEGLHYFAMDYVRGETLAERLKGGPLNPVEAASLLATIAEAVDYLHRNSILHRDLKPSNILLDEDNRPYVTDFGLARIFGDSSQHTRTGTIIGTPSYMSPEQAAGRTKLIGPASDVYSLGAILYETLTGVPPFKEENALDTIVQVIEGEPLPPRRVRPEIPRALERICLKCLEKEPEKRYATGKELAADLQRFLQGETVTAVPPNPWDRLRRWSRRYPATSSRLAAILAAMTVFQTRALLSGVEDEGYHVRIMTIMGGWALLVGLFQLASRNQKIAPYLEFAWTAADAGIMTVLLTMTVGPLGPLVIGYPMVIVASGMFFNVRVVVTSTLCSIAGYLLVLGWHPDEPGETLYASIYLIVLAILGFVTAYQVHRVRVISRYYDKR